MPNPDHFRNHLLALEVKLTRRLKAINRDIRHEGMSADWAEQASERENDEVLESLGNASEAELTSIRAALKRIDEGTYFNCSVCGEAIPLARLNLLPFTTTCVNCAEIKETNEG
jgi:DnaK suppressor protein